MFSKELIKKVTESVKKAWKNDEGIIETIDGGNIDSLIKDVIGDIEYFANNEKTKQKYYWLAFEKAPVDEKKRLYEVCTTTHPFVYIREVQELTYGHTRVRSYSPRITLLNFKEISEDEYSYFNNRISEQEFIDRIS